jgi:hypothetical protein
VTRHRIKLNSQAPTDSRYIRLDGLWCFPCRKPIDLYNTRTPHGQKSRHICSTCPLRNFNTPIPITDTNSFDFFWVETCARIHKNGACVTTYTIVRRTTTTTTTSNNNDSRRDYYSNIIVCGAMGAHSSSWWSVHCAS